MRLNAFYLSTEDIKPSQPISTHFLKLGLLTHDIQKEEGQIQICQRAPWGYRQSFWANIDFPPRF